MVGVINPNATTSLEVQRDDAQKSTFMLQPGQVTNCLMADKGTEKADQEQAFPDESIPPGASSTSSSSSSASPTVSATNAPASTTSAAPPAVAPHSGLGAGAIAGIAIGKHGVTCYWIGTNATLGGAVVLLMAATLVYLCGRNRALSDIIHPKRSHPHSGDFDGSSVQYVQTVPKHTSGMTVVSSRPESGSYMHHSPALPGYMGPHDGVHSPPRTHYAPSDALSPAASVVRSPSPGSTGAPAYTQSPPLPSHTP
jgi:hypothetical protein